MTYQGFGNGSDGPVTLSGTDGPIDSSCSGTAASQSLSATNVLFSNGKLIFIHQSRGTNAGSWELNFIDTYSAGTISTQFPLVNTYVDSGNSQAQVIQVKEYSDVIITSTFTGKEWDGNVGGILIFMCSGRVTNNGTVTVKGTGFRGGAGGILGTSTVNGSSGEGSPGPSLQTSGEHSNSPTNGDGGQGGRGNFGGGTANGGQGGSHAIGAPGVALAGSSGLNAGSASPDTADGSLMLFGGAGGGGGSSPGNQQPVTGGTGGDGGGIIAIWCSELAGSGTFDARGNDGGAAQQIPRDESGGGGGGAGGFIYIVTGNHIFTGSYNVSPGSGGPGSKSSENGIVGTQGRVAISCCSNSNQATFSHGSTQTVGGQDFCQAQISIY